MGGVHAFDPLAKIFNRCFNRSVGIGGLDSGSRGFRDTTQRLGVDAENGTQGKGESEKPTVDGL